IDPEAMQALVPNLVLQPIVENAIKYAVAPRHGAGRVEIRAVKEGSRLVIVVNDDGDGAKALRDADSRADKGLGLSNTRARLAQLYPDHSFKMRIAQCGGREVRIKIPFASAEGAVALEAAGV